MTLSREELIRRLQKLAQSEPPKDLSQGAMCYAVMPPEPQWKIPCPECRKGKLGVRLAENHPLRIEFSARIVKEGATEYDVSEMSYRYFKDIQKIILKKLKAEPEFFQSLQPINQVLPILREYRYPLARLRKLGLEAKLLVPKHCHLCAYGLKQKKFKLKIQYPDDTSSVLMLDETDTLETMAVFLKGGDRIRGGFGRETALKDMIPRLTRWFGVASLPLLCKFYRIRCECTKMKEPENWKSLQTLTLRSKQVDNNWLPIIGQMKQLEELDLSRAALRSNDIQENLASLSELTELRILRLDYCTGLKNELGFLETLQKLEVLNLAGCSKLHARGLKSIAKLPKLRELNLRGGINILDAALERLLPLQELESLDLRGCDSLTPDCIPYLKALPKLKELKAKWSLLIAFKKFKRETG